MTATTTAAPAAPEFNGRKVLSVYSGRPGCACGCRGKHTYHPLTREEASKNRGYEVEAHECSIRGMNIILGKMQKFQESGIKLDDGGSYLAYETESRLYVIYFAD